MRRHSVTTPQNPLAKYHHLAVISQSETPVPLISTAIAIRIIGGLAIVTTERTFQNKEGASIEATLTFPVPVHATLVSLVAKIGDRTVTGRAQGKVKARETYEDALDRGKTAVLHEEALKGIHILSVAHIPPGAEITVIGRWAMPLQVKRDAFLRIPVTVGDIYGQSPLSECDDLVHGGKHQEASVTVSCSDRQVELVGAPLLEGKATVVLDRPIDLVVRHWTPGVLRGVAADGRPVALDLRASPSGDGSLEAAVLVDVSGSMDDKRHHGAHHSKYDIVIQSLTESRLREGDRVDLWKFSDDAHLVGRGNLHAALKHMKCNGGGTQIGRSIKTVLGASESGDLLLITDGKSYDIDVQDLVRSSGRRFTVVLIGDDSLEAQVGYLAALSGGQVFVASRDDAGTAVQAALESMRGGKFTDKPISGQPNAASMTIGGMTVRSLWGSQTHDDATIIDIRFPTMIAGESGPQVAASTGTPAATGVLIEGTMDHDVGRAIAAVAATIAIPHMDEAEATALAVAEGILCHLTSLVLVDEAGAAQEGLPAQRKVATMTPAASLYSSNGMGMVRSASLRAGNASIVASGWSATENSHGSWATHSLSNHHELARFVADLNILRTPKLGFFEDVTPPLASGSVKLAPYKGLIDWGKDPEGLRCGDLTGLSVATRTALLMAATGHDIITMAQALSISSTVALLAILARADAELGDRQAGRFARKVIGSLDAAVVERAAKSVGL